MAHFMTKKCSLSFIVAYAPMELTNGDNSDLDEF